MKDRLVVIFVCFPAEFVKGLAAVTGVDVVMKAVNGTEFGLALWRGAELVLGSVRHLSGLPAL